MIKRMGVLLALWGAACAGTAVDEEISGGGEGLPLAPSPTQEVPNAVVDAPSEADKAIIICPQRSDLRSQITVHNGNWGTWASCPDLCPPGSFAYRINMKSESSRGAGDDTSVNAISLHCHNRTTGAFTDFVESTMGPWGTWLPNAECNNTNTPIVSGNLRLEASQGIGDDTSANGIRVSCAGNAAELTAPANTSWGSFRGKVSCPAGTAVCGIQTRVEGSQGADDDTALNGVRFQCCQLCPAGQEGCSDGICRNIGSCPVPPPPR